MGKVRIISASKSALYHFEHPQIRTSAFYPWPWVLVLLIPENLVGLNDGKAKRIRHRPLVKDYRSMKP